MIFERNIEMLRKTNPVLAEKVVSARKGDDLEIVTTKSGVPSLKAGAVRLHSFYDPKKEAQDWAAYHAGRISNDQELFVLGFGLGYHLSALREKYPQRIVVFEPRVDVLKTAFELIDLSQILRTIEITTNDQIPFTNKGFAVLEHKPSVSVSGNYFVKITAKLKTLQAVRKGLRIMVVGPIYGGSLPIAQYCVNALRQLGHEVDFFDTSRYKDSFFSVDDITTSTTHRDQLKEMFANFISEAVMARCGQFQPDLVFALAQAPLSVNTLQKLRAYTIPLAFWFVEDYKLMEYWKQFGPLYDYFFTIQRGDFLEQLEEAGVANAHYLPLAADPEVHKPIDLNEEDRNFYGSDISFIGAGYHNRRKFFLGLLDLDFKIWGNEWDLNSPLRKCIQKSGQRITTEEIVKIFNASKININLHSSPFHNGIDPCGDFVNPRTFELASCGAFQLVDYREELPQFFNIGEEVVCFSDLNDLKTKAKYYLSHPDEMHAIAQRAMERVKHEHTYLHRMEEMLHFIVNRGYRLPAWMLDREPVADLIEAAGKGSALAEYLAQFRDKGVIGLKDILEEIKKGEGELSTTEKMFMLLDEFKALYCLKRDFV